MTEKARTRNAVRVSMCFDSGGITQYLQQRLCAYIEPKDSVMSPEKNTPCLFQTVPDLSILQTTHRGAKALIY